MPNLPFPTSNNAPLPIPGGYGGQMSGMNFNTPSAGQPFPSFPAYGNPVQGIGGYATPSGPAYNTGAYTASNIGTLSSGFAPYGQGLGTDFYNMLGKVYGKGTGQLLGNVIGGGLFNPQIAAAFLNAQQPGIARGEAGILGAFGNAGARYSSAAALGMGDFESQVQLNQQQTLAQMYQNAQQMQLSELNQVLPSIQQERANQGGWLNTVLGGLEIAGGIAIDAMTAGMGGNMLIAAGANTMAHGHGSSQVSPPSMPSASGFPSNLPGATPMNAPPILNQGPMGTPTPITWQEMQQAGQVQGIQQSAGDVIGTPDLGPNPYPYMPSGPNITPGSAPAFPTGAGGPNTMFSPISETISGGGGVVDYTDPNFDWVGYLMQQNA